MSTKVASFFIQAAGLAYHHRPQSGVYHQGRFGALVSPLQLDDMPQRVADDIQKLRFDDIQGFALICFQKNDIMLSEEVSRLKIHGIKREWSRPFGVQFKKHYCPLCKALLTTAKASKVVNSKSKEAKNYDFSSCDTYMAGNIKFIGTELLCTACGKTYSLQEIRENEKKTNNMYHF